MTNTLPSSEPPASGPASRTTLVLALLAAAATAYSMMQSLVMPALPEIQRAVDLTPEASTWLMTSFLLTSAVATPTIGRLGDLLGLRPMLLVVLAALTAGTLLCALSGSLAGLIAGRALHGVGGAVFPLSFAIVRHQLPAERVPGALGLLSALLGVGGGLGVVTAGAITEYLPYQWLFWLLLPCYAGVWAAAWRVVPAIPPQAAGAVDVRGGVLLGAGLTVVLLAVTFANGWGWTSARTLGLLLAGGLVLVAWVRGALRTPVPLIDVRTLRRRGIWTAHAVALLFGIGLYTSFTLIPQYVQDDGAGLGASPLHAAAFLGPWTIANAIVGVAAGRIERRFGARSLLIAGTACGLLGFVAMTVARDAPIAVYAASGLLGLGVGAAFACLPTLVVRHVSAGETGAATGVNTVLRMIGGALGGQVAAALLAGSGGVATRNGYTAAFAVGLLALAAAIGFSLLVPRNGPDAA